MKHSPSSRPEVAASRALALSLPPASDRNRKHHLSFPEGRFGVDTIALRGPVDPLAADRLPDQRLTRKLNPDTGEFNDRITSARPATGTDLYFQVAETPSGGFDARVEFSAPRMLRPDNRRPADHAELRRAVIAAYDRVDSEVPWLCQPEELTVARIDIARDFEPVENPPQLLEALWDLHAPRVTVLAYRTRNGRGVQTLMRDTRRHTGRMYHRGEHYFARSVGAAPEVQTALRRLAREEDGVIRFEVELRRELAAHEGLGQVRDVLRTPLGRVASAYFNERYRFGDVIAGSAWKLRKAWEAAAAAGETKKLITAFGQLVADVHGIPAAHHEKTTNLYRSAYRSYGLSPRDATWLERGAVRFDFESGRVVELR